MTTGSNPVLTANKTNKMKNERLEKLSDEVRKGHPISLKEVIEVISYQEELKKSRKPQSILKQFFKRLFNK